MQRTDGVVTLSIGVIAAASFLLSFYLTKSLLLPFLPFLVLGVGGFAYDFRTALLASVAAAIAILFFGGLDASVAFAFLFAIPTLLLLYFILRPEPYTVGGALTWLTSYAAVLVILIALAATSEPGGLEAVVKGYLKQMLPMMEPEIAPQVEARFNAYPYAFLAIPVAYLVIACYGVMWLSRWLVILGDGKDRPKIGIAPFNPPLLLPVFLIVAALFSFMGDGSVVFAAKALFLILLLPYFLSGLSLLHHASRNWAGRFWILLLLYLSISISPWVMAAIATLGGASHVRSMIRKQE